MIGNASAKRPTSLSWGRPKASNSSVFQPAPMPSTNRPELISPIVAAILASTAGGWNAAQATKGPNSTRSVTAAKADNMVHASYGPRSERAAVAR